MSRDHGWALGDAPCGTGRCGAIWQTGDGGRTWHRGPGLPAQLRDDQGTLRDVETDERVERIRFADDRNGWLYGTELWATHDGGRHWKQVGVATRGIDLEVSGHVVWFAAERGAAGGTIDVDSAPTTSDRFTPAIGLPAQGQLQGLITHGDAAWVWLSEAPTDSNLALFGTRGGSNWVQMATPCGSGDMSVAASSMNDLHAACDSGSGGACQFDKQSYVSDDGGRHWLTRGKVEPTADRVGLLAAATSEVAVMASQCASSDLDATFDGGRHWEQVDEEPTGGAAWREIGFTTPTQGYVILGDLAGGEPTIGSRMLMTRDGGHHWAATNLP